MGKQKNATGQLPLENPMSPVAPSKEGVADLAVNRAEPRFSDKSNRQEFFLPVTGFVWLYPEEVAIVDHPTFQRLGRIYQLGQTYLVYRGATHRRIEHVLGALHVVQRMIDAVEHNSKKPGMASTPSAAPLSESERRFTRLGALLHDIGHVAAGHTLEDELQLIGKHDGDERLDQIFDGPQWAVPMGSTLGQVIDSEFEKYVPRKLASEGIKASQIVRLLIRKQPKNHKLDKYVSVQNALDSSDEIRVQVCCNMIGNTICADLLDYLHRDWYHVGKPRPFDERILQYMEIRTQPDVLGATLPTPKPTDAFVISLGKRPKIRTDAVSAILELLEWRYQLAESVLFHRTKLAAAAMLDRALYELWKGHKAAEVEKFVLPLGDDQFLSESIKRAEEQKNQAASSLLASLDRRDLYAALLTFTHDDLPADIRAAVQGKYADPEQRAKVLTLLEGDFNLPPASLAMYCPTAGMNVKIAEVNIAVGNDVEKFSIYEREHENQLSGGHLDAQIHRFHRLWRVHFFIKHDVKESLNQAMLHALRHAIEKLALGNVHDEDGDHVAKSLASLLSSLSQSPWHAYKTREEPVVAAYRGEEFALGRYPFGAASIRSYLEKS